MNCDRCGFYCCDESREDCPICGTAYAVDAVEVEEVEEDGQIEDDGQPTEYEEWQDLYGGDVEEYGTFGCYDNE